METVDEEFLAAALDFIDRQVKAGKPFFCYFNSTRMHVFTHLKPASQGKTGLGLYPDGMVEHGHVGQLLKKLDDPGIANNTIVVYTTDNGAEVMSWPDGGSTPFRGEKATNWEGGLRLQPRRGDRETHAQELVRQAQGVALRASSHGNWLSAGPWHGPARALTALSGQRKIRP
jgi:hypothetical protein